MKKLLKTLGISLLMIILMSTFVFAEDLQEIETYSEYDSATFSQAAQNYHSQLEAATDEEYEEFLTSMAESPDILQGFESYKKIRESEDAFVQYGPYALYQTEEGLPVIYQVLEHTSNYYVIACGFDTELYLSSLQVYEVTNFKVGDEIPTTFDLTAYELGDISGAAPFKLVFDAEVLKGAAGNTVIGLGVVFSVLIFISIIIGLFKFISPEGRNYKPAPVPESEPAKTKVEESPAPAVVLTDDKQLVAAITAAISAYEGKSADSFVVRTIKKRRW